MRTIYYTDELGEDFSRLDIGKGSVPENFVYVRKGILWRMASFFLYRIVAPPVAFAVCKLFHSAKYVGKEKFKGVKGGYFLYLNHTMLNGDAFNPHMVTFPKRTELLVGGASIANKALLKITPMLHAVPIPSSMKQMAAFRKAIDEFYVRGDCIAIYPEAHLWPYYTGIRPFGDVSFRYPAELGAPVFTATVTYKKRKVLKRPKIVVYIDGPFMPDPEKSVRENKKMLRDVAYSSMKERAKNSDCEYYKYIKAQDGARKQGEEDDAQARGGEVNAVNS